VVSPDKSPIADGNQIQMYVDTSKYNALNTNKQQTYSILESVDLDCKQA
jgi:hypothetical protein